LHTLLFGLLRPLYRSTRPRADPSRFHHSKTEIHRHQRHPSTPKIKADAALAADCLTEGKAWAAKNSADAGQGAQAGPADVPQRRVSMERNYENARWSTAIMSASSDQTIWTLVAPHPNSDVNTILWDSAANKRISIRPSSPRPRCGAT